MHLGTVFLLFFSFPSAAAQKTAVATTYRYTNYPQTQPAIVYSLPPAIHYVHEQQWLQYKREHDEEEQRQLRLATAHSRPPVAAYTNLEPYQPPLPTGPPGRAEVTGFEATFKEVVKAFIAANARANNGAFSLKDDRTGETLRLKFSHAHTDRLHYHSSSEISGCVDFETVDAPKRGVDLDFELKKDWDWAVSRIFIHIVNGRERFAYNEDLARVGVGNAAEAPAAARIPRPTAPANLSAEVRFAESSEDGGRALSITVANAGPGDAYSVRLNLDTRSAPAGISLPPNTSFGDLRAGQSATKTVPVAMAAGAKGGRVQAVAAVLEANGFDTEPVLVEFEADPAAVAALELSAATVEGGIIKPGATTRLSISVRNAGRARAAGVRAALRLGGSDLFMSSASSAALGDLGPGESKEAVFEFFVNRRVGAGAGLPVFLSASDSKGAHGFSERELPLKMGQTAGPLRVVSISGRDDAAPSVDTPPAARTPQDPRAYAVVVGIEKYRDVAGVDYAARDAQTVYDYLTGSMGFKAENIVLLKDERAGRADLTTYLGPWLADRTSGGKSRVFIYYSGHGTVDPKTGETYLVPYDGDPSYPETKGYALKDLYAALGRLPGADTVVALDSCFSGSGGRSIMAPGVRPLMSVKSAQIPGNIVVLSASGGDQISAAHPIARHGLMTYYLLSGLDGAADFDHNGRITTLELFNYLGPAVEADARRQHIEQRPRLEPSPESIGARGDRVWLVR